MNNHPGASAAPRHLQGPHSPSSWTRTGLARTALAPPLPLLPLLPLQLRDGQGEGRQRHRRGVSGEQPPAFTSTGDGSLLRHTGHVSFCSTAQQGTMGQDPGHDHGHDQGQGLGLCLSVGLWSPTSFSQILMQGSWKQWPPRLHGGSRTISSARNFSKQIKRSLGTPECRLHGCWGSDGAACVLLPRPSLVPVARSGGE